MSWLNETEMVSMQKKGVLQMTPEERRGWLDQRRKGIGASDAAVILGMSKYRTAYQLWHEKLGIKIDNEMSEEQLWGLVHEPTIAAMYEIRTGRQIHQVKGFLAHPRWPIRYANLDRVARDRIVQIKTSSVYTGWGPDGSDVIPDEYLIQVTHEMDCAAASLCDLVVLLCGNRMRIYPIRFNPVLAEEIEKSQITFWDHVTRRVPPAIDWKHATTSDFIEDLFAPGVKVVTIEDTTEPVNVFVREYLAIGKEEKRIDLAKKEVRAKLVTRMGEDAGKMIIPGGYRVVRGKQFRVYGPNED